MSDLTKVNVSQPQKQVRKKVTLVFGENGQWNVETFFSAQGENIITTSDLNRIQRVLKIKQRQAQRQDYLGHERVRREAEAEAEAEAQKQPQQAPQTSTSLEGSKV